MINQNIKLLYIGETTDYSDQWLASVLKEDFDLEIATPNQCDKVLETDNALVINRLYLTTALRFSAKDMTMARSLVRKARRVINNDYGWVFGADRHLQKELFKDDYIQTISSDSLSQIDKSDFPFVLKKNCSGRNNFLDIINDYKQLRAIQGKHVLQPLIRDNRCYRTEFIGNWYITYDQELFFEKERLSFEKNHKQIKEPLNSDWYIEVCKKISNLGIEAFSVEYFVVNNRPIIIDFNTTSNYTKEFISNNQVVLSEAWKGLVHEKTIE